MSSEVSFWLHSVTVVVIAKFHNPSILNRDFLANNNIVDSKWETVETISTPAVSMIQYDNGIKWLVDQQILDISKNYNVPFTDEHEDEIHRLAASYIKKLPHVSYQAIGLNCVVSIENNEPLQWMTQKFLKSEQLDNNIEMIPRFIIKTDKATLNLNFRWKTMRRGDKKTPSVVIDCNLHHDGPFDSVESMEHVLTGWGRAKNIIESKLNEILEST